MKRYESMFLGLILAGILMLVTGLGLMASSARSPDATMAFAENRGIAPSPPLARPATDGRNTPTSRTR